MARLSYDALLLLARLSADYEHTVTRIAYDVFAGYNPDSPNAPTRVAVARTMRACQVLVAMKRAIPIPNKRDMQAIRIIDHTGGAIQAQFLMNLMVRGGEERRREDRRTRDEPYVGERRQGPRRIEPEGVPRPKRIVRAVVRQLEPRVSTPFDILDTPSAAPVGGEPFSFWNKLEDK